VRSLEPILPRFVIVVRTRQQNDVLLAWLPRSVFYKLRSMFMSAMCRMVCCLLWFITVSSSNAMRSFYRSEALEQILHGDVVFSAFP
jgi:hypothetical protein